MTAHLKYASYVVRHKWFVFRAGLRTSAPLWRLVIHDWTKFTPAEWGPYVERFYGGRLSDDSIAFSRAWLHHQHRNPHHWQHWVLRQDGGEIIVLPMPEQFVREMVADWMGAGRAITGRWSAAEWYRNSAGAAMHLHPKTRALAERLLAAESREQS